MALVIQVENRRLLDSLVERFIQHPEQAALRSPVLLDCMVKVQVVRAKIGEHCDIVFTLVHAMKRETMRGRLDNSPPATRLDHLRQHDLKLWGFRSREAPCIGERRCPNATLCSADKARFFARHGKEVIEQMHQTRLSVRTRDADRIEFLRWMSLQRR